jgi:hypothetical protein
MIKACNARIINDGSGPETAGVPYANKQLSAQPAPEHSWSLVPAWMQNFAPGQTVLAFSTISADATGGES